MTGVPHPLDRPIWNALHTKQASLALGGPQAMKFVPEIAAFADTLDDGDASLAALAQLIPEDGFVYLVRADEHPIPPGTFAEKTAIAVQMIAESFVGTPHPEEIEPLGPPDIAEMMALTALTEPGPFFARTHELGQFWGVRENGRLAAMAGERLKLPGLTELSGVCTHPDFRGRGYAALLSKAVCSLIVARGETPFLHCYADNAGAIALYERLGFRIRARMNVTVLRRT